MTMGRKRYGIFKKKVGIKSGTKKRQPKRKPAPEKQLPAFDLDLLHAMIRRRP